MPWVYRDPSLGYFILKHAAFAYHIRKYDPFTESVVQEIQQGLPFTLPAAWNRVEMRNGRTFGIYNKEMYDITDVLQQPSDSQSPR
jgi:hypothetical protein